MSTHKRAKEIKQSTHHTRGTFNAIFEQEFELSYHATNTSTSSALV